MIILPASDMELSLVVGIWIEIQYEPGKLKRRLLSKRPKTKKSAVLFCFSILPENDRWFFLFLVRVNKKPKLEWTRHTYKAEFVQISAFFHKGGCPVPFLFLPYVWFKRIHRLSKTSYLGEFERWHKWYKKYTQNNANWACHLTYHLKI